MGFAMFLIFIFMFISYKMDNYNKNKYPEYWKAYIDPKIFWKRNELWEESESMKNDSTIKLYTKYVAIIIILILLSFVAMIFYCIFFW